MNPGESKKLQFDYNYSQIDYNYSQIDYNYSQIDYIYSKHNLNDMKEHNSRSIFVQNYHDISKTERPRLLSKVQYHKNVMKRILILHSLIVRVIRYINKIMINICLM